MPTAVAAHGGLAGALPQRSGDRADACTRCVAPARYVRARCPVPPPIRTRRDPSIWRSTSATTGSPPASSTTSARCWSATGSPRRLATSGRRSSGSCGASSRRGPKTAGMLRACGVTCEGPIDKELGTVAPLHIPILQGLRDAGADPRADQAADRAGVVVAGEGDRRAVDRGGPRRVRRDGAAAVGRGRGRHRERRSAARRAAGQRRPDRAHERRGERRASASAAPGDVCGRTRRRWPSRPR